MFRGDARTYAADPLARAVAERALARGFDRQVPLPDRQFFYLPFEHSETLADQERCCALFRRDRRRRPSEMGASCTPTSSAGSAASRTATPCSAAPPRRRSRPFSTAAASRARPKSAGPPALDVAAKAALNIQGAFEEIVHVVADSKFLPWRADRGRDAVRDIRIRPDGAQDHRAGGARRRLGPDRALDAAGADRREAREKRAGHQHRRRRRHRRPRAVRQRRQGRRQPAHGQRLRHGRRHPDEQVAGLDVADHADRQDHRGNPDHGGAGEFADQDRQGPRRSGEEGRRQGDVRRRLGRRRRSHHGGAVRRRGRRRRLEGQLRGVLRRRRVARRDPRRQGHRRHFRL